MPNVLLIFTVSLNLLSRVEQIGLFSCALIDVCLLWAVFSESHWYCQQAEMIFVVVFYLLGPAFPFKMRKFFECILCLIWRVTSVKRNNLRCTMTTLSANKEWGRQMMPLSLIARANKTAKPSMKVWNCVWREILYVWGGNNEVGLQSKCYKNTAVFYNDFLGFWGVCIAECVA